MLVLFVLLFQADVKELTETHDGLVTLRHELVLDADRETVWQLFTTEAGVKSWITPVAWIDLRVDGIMETSYDAGAKPGDANNIKVQFTAVDPGRSYTARNIQSPANTPFGPVLKQIPSTLQLEDVADGKVKVIIIMRGFQQTEEHQQVLNFFKQGNHWYLNRLQQRLKQGPLPF